MFDFRLKVFHTVAKRLSFTKAANELFITQPAITHHIHEIEHQFKIKLFDRNGNKIGLTPAGVLLFRHTEKIFDQYRDLKFEMNTLSQLHNGILHIGASSTIAQYLIPPILSEFHKKFKEVKIELNMGNTTQIEQGLLNKEIELGLIEGKTKNQQISYQEFAKDELVLVCQAVNPLVKKDTIRIDDIKKFPLLLREPGSGTLEVIAHALSLHNLKISDLQVEMQLGSTESIKSYLQHSFCLAFLSVHSILKELKNNEMRIIDVKELNIVRPFYFIHAQGPITALPELFMRFAKSSSIK